MPKEVPPDLVEFAENTQREFERDPNRSPLIIDITKTTEGLIFHVLDNGRMKVISHSWDDIAQKRDKLLREFFGEPAAA